MNEIKFLKKLVRLEQEKYTLEIKIDVWSRDHEVKEFKQELTEVEKEIELTKQSLQNIEDKSYSRKAKESMFSQIDAYIIEINKVSNNLKLSRNQGLGLDNYLFSSILNDLRYYIIDEFHGHRIPAYLIYTYSNENSVEIKMLSDFLKNELKILNQIQNPDFIKLRNFYDDFKNRIIDKFVK